MKEKFEVEYSELVSLPVDKSKFLSVWSKVGDNTNNSWQHIIEINHKYVSFLLSETSKYFDLDEIKVVFDVGSLNGIESVYFSQLLPKSKVYSFEANPDSVLLVESNQKDYPNIKCINKAISDKEGSDIVFYLPKDNIGAASLLKPIGGLAGSVFTTINVDVTTIEKFSIENNIDKIDILWMDLQGNELNAFKGMGDMLHNVKIICSEVGLIPYYENHTLYNEIYDYLKIYGFEKSETIYPFDYSIYQASSYEKDFVFINKRLYEKQKNKKV